MTLTTWLRDSDHVVVWQTKNEISSLTQRLRPPNLVGGDLYWGELTHNVTWSSDYMIK